MHMNDRCNQCGLMIKVTEIKARDRGLDQIIRWSNNSHNGEEWQKDLIKFIESIKLNP